MSPDDLDQLNVHLYKIDSFTNNIYLSSPSQVMLGEDGMTQNALRYSLPCLKKVCYALTPRLFGLLIDVASGSVDVKSRSRATLESTANRHVLAAISIFNRVVEDYFDRLDGAILMENAGTGNYDGFVFTDSKAFELSSIVGIIISMFTSGGWNVINVFMEDRFLRIVFASSEKVETDDGYAFSIGACVDINPSWKSNCISGCRTIIRSRDGIFTRQEVRTPASRTFDAVRAAASIATVLMSQDHNERYTERARNNLGNSEKFLLGFSAKENGGVVTDRSHEKIVVWMVRNKVQRRHAVDIVNLTISWGGSEEYAVESSFVSPDDIEGRTWFDLAINMLRHADKIMGNQSDIIRGLANQILLYQVAAMED